MASAGFSIGLLLILPSDHAVTGRVKGRERRSSGCPHVAPRVLLPAFPILAGFRARRVMAAGHPGRNRSPCPWIVQGDERAPRGILLAGLWGVSGEFCTAPVSSRRG